jgi:hypothetical protein
MTALDAEVISLIEEDQDEEDDTDDDSDVVYSSVSGIVKINQSSDVLDDKCCLAYSSSLELLAAHSPRDNCNICGEGYEIKMEHKGTALYMTWVCIISKFYNVPCIPVAQKVLFRTLANADVSFPQLSSIL